MKKYKKMNKIELICNYLDEILENPKCELNYNNDYELLIATMLSAQTTDKSVNKTTAILFSKYNNLEKISNAKIEDLEEIIRPIGTYHIKSKNTKEIATILLNEYNGKVPVSQKELIKLPGVGRKVANVFLGEYYKIPAIAVDTHVFRVSKKLGLSSQKDNVLKTELKLQKCFPKEEWYKRHLQLVLFGRYYCKAKKPLCNNCKLKDICNEKNDH